MKCRNKALILILICLMLLSMLFGGCKRTSDNIGSDMNNESIIIAASFYPVYVMTLNVAKNIPGVKVVNMTQPSAGCLHDYTLTTEDMKNLEKARFLVINGAGLESFLDKVISQLPGLQIIDSSEGILMLEGPEHDGHNRHNDDTGSEHEHGEVNPHIWVSVSKAILQVKNIGKQLADMDPEHAEEYMANTENYVKKLEELKERMHKALEGVKNRDIVTFHEAFPYFAEEFGLNVVGVIEIEPGSEPSAKELGEIIEKVREFNVKALFIEPQYSSKAAETVARETGAKVYTLDPAVTGPMGDDAYDAYINIMENNLKTLVEALGE